MSTRPPLVSVVMSVLNGGDLLRPAVDSILAQSEADLEFIIIDDGSDDLGPTWLECLQDPRVRFLRDGEHRGVVVRRNQGMMLARGKFIAVMDGDDIALPDRFARQLHYLRGHPEVMACGMDVLVEDDVWGHSRWRYPQSPERVRAGLLFHNTLAHPTLMMRSEVKEVLQPIYREGFERAEDYDMLVRLTDCCHISNLPRPGLIYRLHPVVRVAQGRHLHPGAHGVRDGILYKLGLDPSDAERHFHQQLAMAMHQMVQIDPDKTADWLEQIMLANGHTGVFEERALRQVLSETWLRIASLAELTPTVAHRRLSTMRFRSDLGHRVCLYQGFIRRRLLRVLKVNRSNA